MIASAIESATMNDAVTGTCRDRVRLKPGDGLNELRAGEPVEPQSRLPGPAVVPGVLTGREPGC